MAYANAVALPTRNHNLSSKGASASLLLCQSPEIDARQIAHRSISLIRMVLDQTKINPVDVAVECVFAGNKKGFDAAFDYADLHDLKRALINSNITLHSKELFNEACVQINAAIEALHQKQHLEHHVTNIVQNKTNKTNKSKI